MSQLFRSKSTCTCEEWKENHFSWILVDKPSVSIKLEEIPPGGSSDLHYHKNSLQFFFIIKGRALFYIDTQKIYLKENEGVEVPPLVKHKIESIGNESLVFILVSAPKVLEEDILRD